MKKIYTSPESFVIALDVEDIVTASNPAVTTTIPGTTDPGTTEPGTTAPTYPEIDLNPSDPWLPTVTDWE